VLAGTASCLAGLLLLASCGSGSRASSPSVVPSSTAPDRTEVSVDTEAGSVEPEVSEPEPANVDTTTAPTTAPSSASSATGAGSSGPTLEPLTGLPATDQDEATRPALIVKIDGHLGARPQFGLDRADVVIEEIVEGITRFMAVFHSEVPDVIGPVRSARTQDMLIAPMFVRPLFTWSGGNHKVTALVKKSPVVNLSATSTGRVKGLWYRTKKRKAPHNLLTRGALLLAQAPDGSKAPPSIFGYRAAGAVVGGREVSGAKLVLSSTRVVWLWDSKRQGWLRTSDRKAHVVDAGPQIAPANVVVLEVRYKPSAADPNSPEAQTIGTGKVLVFTAGHLVVGTWTRDDVNKPWALADNDGRPILLTPGRTWVELAHAAKTSIIDVGVKPADVPFRTK